MKKVRFAGYGHVAFAATLVALGAQGLLTGDFTAIWAPVPAGAPGRTLLAYACALVSLATGAGLLGRRTATHASRALLVYLVVWLALWRGRDLLGSLGKVVYYESFSEVLVIVAGAWVLYARLAPDGDRRGRLAFASGARGLRVARVLYGLALLGFGAAHFAYVRDTAALVPAWLPAPAAWVRFTGATFIAAGAAVLTGVAARPAAALSAIQLGLFTLLVWAPAVVLGTRDASTWSELSISVAITSGAWVVAQSYRDASPGT
jgi:uncharacterized membrane protein YphA (DoxX/SURF4 family)